ncbi:hypothetical protein THF1C08_50244 [Vibrio jasicida]|nr:hypothetical protein THF1C08_50244 [Vibrio jasicida]
MCSTNPQFQSEILLLNPQFQSEILLLNPQFQSEILLLNPQFQSEIITFISTNAFIYKSNIDQFIKSFGYRNWFSTHVLRSVEMTLSDLQCP